MSVEAADAYEKARKLGKRETTPENMPPVLDHLLDPAVSYSQERAGQKEIALSQIAGMKNEGRISAFGKDFLPLLKSDTEFAAKWMRLYDAQISEGLRDPIKVYEYLHKYYVEEGNKRVSVMKFLGGKTIMAQIVRILPDKDGSEEAQVYYEYLEFSRIHNIDFIHFSKPGEYKKLEQLLALPSQYGLNDEQEKQLRSEYHLFEQAFEQVKNEQMHLSVAEAFLLYLEIYTVDSFLEKSGSILVSELKQIEEDLEAYPHKLETRLETASLNELQAKQYPLKATIQTLKGGKGLMGAVFAAQEQCVVVDVDHERSIVPRSVLGTSDGSIEC